MLINGYFSRKLPIGCQDYCELKNIHQNIYVLGVFASCIISVWWIACGKSTHIRQSASPLKRKCRFDDIFITGFQGSKWWKYHQNDKMSLSGISSGTIVWSHDKTHWNEKSPYDFRVHFVFENCYKLTTIKREPCDDVNPVIVEYECDVIKHGFIMMMQWLGNTFRISSTCEGNPSVTVGWFHHMAVNAELRYSLLLTW